MFRFLCAPICPRPVSVLCECSHVFAAWWLPIPSLIWEVAGRSCFLIWLESWRALWQKQQFCWFTALSLGNFSELSCLVLFNSASPFLICVQVTWEHDEHRPSLTSFWFHPASEMLSGSASRCNPFSACSWAQCYPIPSTIGSRAPSVLVGSMATRSGCPRLHPTWLETQVMHTEGRHCDGERFVASKAGSTF